MKRLSYFLSSFIILFIFASCSEQFGYQMDQSDNDGEETMGFAFTVELETGDLETRAPGQAGFGNGNQINNLMYALYTQDSSADDTDDEGDLKPVKLWDETTQQYANLIRVPFNPSQVNRISIDNIDIIKGIEYTLMLWAQYRPDDESLDDKIYFELRDNGIIRIMSYDGYLFPNNDDQRDVFCAVYKIVQYEDSRDLHLVLRRPFAQVNIGADAKILKQRRYIDDNDKLLIEQSAITMTGDIANRYNLFKNRAEKSNDLAYTRSFALATIPAKSPNNGYNESEGYRMLKIKDRDTNEETEFIWLSMCYILPDGKLGDVSSINIDDFTFTYMQNNKLITKSLTGSGTEAFLTDVPILRNRRTNIILNAKDFGPWYEEEHSLLDDESSFNELIGLFMDKIPKDYTDKDGTTSAGIAEIKKAYGDYILMDYDGYYAIMLGGNTYNLTRKSNGTPILPVHSDFILYGNGETTIIKPANKKDNRFYHNIGQIRNIHIVDTEGKNHIFIDLDGFLWITDESTGELMNTNKKLDPLKDHGSRSYDIYIDGEISYSDYYHS